MNFSRALVTLRGMADSIIAGLPNFILALAIFLLFYFVARRTRFFVVRLTDKQHKRVPIPPGRTASAVRATP